MLLTGFSGQILAALVHALSDLAHLLLQSWARTMAAGGVKPRRGSGPSLGRRAVAARRGHGAECAMGERSRRGGATDEAEIGGEADPQR